MTSESRNERRCETCGNVYDKVFAVEMDGERHVFDCFECAIHALAPLCTTCGIRTIGHGVEGGGRLYCSGHCARVAGIATVVDRAEHARSRS